MEIYGWGKTTPVDRGLFREGHRFDFFQAVRLLELMAPDRVGVGEESYPDREVVNFTSRIRLDYPPTTVDSIRPARRAGEPAEMTVNFLSLAGVLGPLPAPVVERILERVSRRDTAFRDFLDLFNHRLISLLFRARKKHRASLQDRPPDRSRFSRSLFSLVGLGTPNLRDRMRVKDRSLLRASGLLAMTSRSMVGLERLLEEHFQVPVQVRPFDGRWFPLEPEAQTLIGPKGINRVLGRGAVLGGRVWIQDAGYCLWLGPLSLAQYLDLLPNGRAFRALCELARFYASQELSFTVRLTLKREEVPQLTLGSAGDSRLGWSARLERGPAERVSEPRLGRAGGARLGWTSWLRGEEVPEKDASLALAADNYEDWQPMAAGGFPPGTDRGEAA